MNARKDFTRRLADWFNIDRCIYTSWAYRPLIEFLAILVLVLLFSLPAIFWNF